MREGLFFPGRNFSARQRDELIDRAPRDAERHAAYSNREQAEEWKSVKRGFHHRLAGAECESAIVGHQDILHREVVAAGSAQSRRIPGIENLDFTRRKYHQAKFGVAGGTEARFIALEDHRPASDPVAVLRRAAPFPVSVDEVSTFASNRFSGGRDRTAGYHQRVRPINLARSRRRQKTRQGGVPRRRIPLR